MSVPDLHFLRPEWLWLLLPTVFFVVVLLRQKTRRSAWSDIIAPHLLTHLQSATHTKQTQHIAKLLGLAWLLGIIGAAGPSWEQTPVPVSQQKAAYVIVLDLSYSMYAEDIQPSRIVKAKQKIRDLLSLPQDTQVALVAYSGEAHVVTPLTDDLGTIENLIPALNPTMMPVPGSNPIDAFERAKELLSSSGVPGGSVLWLTDDIETSQAAELSDWLDQAGTRLVTMAVGTPAGAPIPLGNGGFLRDQNSEIVVPAVPIARLQELTASHGGLFSNLTLDDTDVLAAVEFMSVAEKLNRTEIERQADTWADAGFWLIIPWVVVMLAQFARNPSGRLAGIMAIGWLATLFHPLEVQAQDWRSLWKTPNQRAAELLPTDPSAAAEIFEDPTWAAIAAYQAEDHEQAKARFEALETSSATDWYNLGNARAKAGQLEAALEAYNQSISRSETEDAVFNRDLIQRLLNQQQQQQNQDMDQQGDGSQSQNDQNNSETDGSSGQQEQSEDQKSEGESGASDGSEQASNPEQDQQQEKAQTQSQQNQNGQQAQDSQQPAQQQASAQDSIDQEQQAMAQQAIQETRENQEQQQAMEQWIRRIEDDPSGLLREKFRYESERRQNQNRPRNDKKIW